MTFWSILLHSNRYACRLSFSGGGNGNSESPRTTSWQVSQVLSSQVSPLSLHTPGRASPPPPEKQKSHDALALLPQEEEEEDHLWLLILT